jgi:hypothetical protein
MGSIYRRGRLGRLGHGRLGLRPGLRMRTRLGPGLRIRTGLGPGLRMRTRLAAVVAAGAAVVTTGLTAVVAAGLPRLTRMKIFLFLYDLLKTIVNIRQLHARCVA